MSKPSPLVKPMTEEERKDFEARFGDQSNVIRIAFKSTQLIGMGKEYLVLTGSVVRFEDGKINPDTATLKRLKSA